MNGKRYYLICLCLVLMYLPGTEAIASPIVFQSHLYDGPFEPVSTVDDCPFDPDTPVLEVTAVGIGCGDCYLIRCGGENMLLDGGEEFRYPPVRRYLEKLGIHSANAVEKASDSGETEDTRAEILNYMFLTHAHRDHYEVQAELLRHDYVPTRLYTIYDEDSSYSLWREYRKWIDKKHVPVVCVRNEQDIQVGQANLRIYRCTGPEADTRGENNRSAVVKITYGNSSVLLTADIEGYGQLWLLEHYRNELDVDIGKAPHHGISQSYPEFLEAMSPDLMIINDERNSAAGYERQMRKHHIPRLYATQHIHMVTDGQLWYVWMEKKK